MKTVGLRSLYKTAPTLTEQVLVTYDGEVIGRYIPNGAGSGVPMKELPVVELSDAEIDAEVRAYRAEKRAVLPVEEIRAVKTAMRDTFGSSRPAPKPGSKK